MNKEDLKKFIYEASRATYASGDESIKQRENDSSTTISFSAGDYSYHDNYFGGEPYGGREVVFHKNRPVWLMVYYGLVYEGAVNSEVYKVLMMALSATTPEMPYRGPIEYLYEDWKYSNVLFGDVERFSGTEKIFKGDICVYEASYMGGFVDR